MRTSAWVCILLCIHNAKPMESFATLSQGCKPLEILSAFWNENKQLLYCTSAIFLGGCFLYDWYCKGQRIKQLEQDVHALQIDRTTTTILSEIRRVESGVEKLEKTMDVHDKDLTYLWRYVITDPAIHDHNKINNDGKPYEKRPYIPWFNGKNIIDLIKKFATYEPQEFKGEPLPFHIAMPLPSPRRHSPPRSNSPTNTTSPRNEENGGNGNGKKNSRKSPERKEKEKEKEK